MDLVLSWIIPCRWHPSISAVPAGVLPPSPRVHHHPKTQTHRGDTSSARPPEGPWQPVCRLPPALASLAGSQLDPRWHRGHSRERALNWGWVPAQIQMLCRFCWWTSIASLLPIAGFGYLGMFGEVNLHSL